MTAAESLKARAMSLEALVSAEVLIASAVLRARPGDAFHIGAQLAHLYGVPLDGSLQALPLIKLMWDRGQETAP